ncbi:MAG: Uma2 family endonuclease [Burkholderiaceae bacterium]|nr:Uma2 family endonuclease [Burkholderiaceae bacterium]
MSAVSNPPRFAHAEDYLAWEAQQAERHELVDGEVYAMVGARLTHNTIALNAVIFLRQALKGTPCRVHGLDAKLNTDTDGNFLYPDAMVTCDPRDRQPGEDRFISHPWLVVEVLSDSTAAYDRGRKFEIYRTLDTLTHYLLVEQDRAHADLFSRNEQGLWVLRPLTANDLIPIERIAQPWPVASLFEEVDFAPPAQPATPQAPD